MQKEAQDIAAKMARSRQQRRNVGMAEHLHHPPAMRIAEQEKPQGPYLLFLHTAQKHAFHKRKGARRYFPGNRGADTGGSVRVGVDPFFKH